MPKFQLIILSCLCLILLSGCSSSIDSVQDYVDTAEQIQDSTTNTPDSTPQNPDSDLSIDTILNKKWQLIELNGVAFDSHQSPYLQFSSDSKISGFAGCNNFFGSFEIQDPLQLKFSDLGSTMMFCPDSSQLELDFLAVFPQVDNFTLSQNGQELSLNKARMAPLARFSLVE
jgi:heat shock protein HslJ